MFTAEGITTSIGFDFEAADGRRPELITKP